MFAAFNVLRPGAIERVKKIEDRDYAFVHFLTREDALYAVQVYTFCPITFVKRRIVSAVIRKSDVVH